jgi:hypothetical protein
MNILNQGKQFGIGNNNEWSEFSALHIPEYVAVVFVCCLFIFRISEREVTRDMHSPRIAHPGLP